MVAATLSLLILLFITSLHQTSALSPTYNVVAFGARGDGRTDSTKAFLGAWAAACASPVPAIVYVPHGAYLLGQIRIEGQCQSGAVTIHIDGTLVAPSDYQVLENEDNWIVFVHVSGVSIYGGTLDGQGGGLWACKASGRACPHGVTSLEISNSNNVVIGGLTSVNSQMFHMVINGCNNVEIDGVKVSAWGNSPNTDGIHVSLSSGVTISNTVIATGDDCISIGPGTTNLWIEKIICGPGHGISIGSLGKDFLEPGVQNVTVNAVKFVGTQNGVRIKTWGRPSKGFVRDVLFQHATMINVENPIIIDQNYCPNSKNCPQPQMGSGIKINDVTFQDIHGSSATQVAVTFDCSKSYPCSGIRLEDVDLTYRNEPPQCFCANVRGITSGFVQPIITCL